MGPKIKNTARPRPAGLQQAIFEPRDHAASVNSWPCSQCDHRFSTSANRKRHQRDQHNLDTPRYACPFSPTRMYSRRGDLRVHYESSHPETDVDDVDEVESIIVVRQEPAQPSHTPLEPAPPSTTPLAGKEVIQVDDGESPTKKRKKVAPPTATAAATSADVLPNAPLGEEELNHLDHSASRRLIKIVETIKREYIFE